jgi:hypothetical protein
MKGSSQILPDSLTGGSPLLIDSSEIIEVGIQHLEKILADILIGCNHSHLCEPIYLSIRELIQNATKACLKRIIFDDIKINPDSKEEYATGIKIFNRIIHSEEIVPYRIKLARNKYYYRIRIDYIQGAIIVQVINVFPLFPFEEYIIRQKFANIKSSSNLYDFYMRHSDLSEGAGMGIALISILLKNSGLNYRNFSIFNNQEGKAVARIIVPVTENYRSPREEFLLKMKDTDDIESLRNKVHTGKVKLSTLPD